MRKNFWRSPRKFQFGPRRKAFPWNKQTKRSMPYALGNCTALRSWCRKLSLEPSPLLPRLRLSSNAAQQRLYIQIGRAPRGQEACDLRQDQNTDRNDRERPKAGSFKAGELRLQPLTAKPG